MGWRDLLQVPEERIVAPWLGGRSLHVRERRWTIDGPLPAEHGWYEFVERKPRIVDTLQAVGVPEADYFIEPSCGYLIGDHFIQDGVASRADKLEKMMAVADRVHLIEPGLDRFVRILAGRAWPDGPFIFVRQEMPLGPEEDVLQAFLDQKKSIADVSGVTPALDMAFRFETLHREQTEKRRREEQAKRELEERRRRIAEQLGDGAGRRAVARFDFAEAARAALAVGGAQYLDHRKAIRGDEMVVRFRFNGRRFECVCESTTLQIIDSGICLTDHDTGEKGDTYFTLESLPAVIHQAEQERKLVVYRHVD